MAATFKPKFMALLLVYSMLLLAQVGESRVTKPCTLECILDIHYMTCPFSGDKKLPASCSCCASHAPKGCVLHASDGRVITHCK